MNQKGFTLIELLVVISIIGVLSSIVMVSLDSARNRAKYAIAKSDVKQITDAAFMAKEENSKSLVQITGNGCSLCGVCQGRDLRNIPDIDACVVRWYNALAKIEAAGITKGLTSFKRDPWGSPYCLDENELEFNLSDCRKDSLRSVGPDGVYGTSDDYRVSIPNATKYCF